MIFTFSFTVGLTFDL